MLRAALFALSMTTAFCAPALAADLSARQTVQKIVTVETPEGETVTTLEPADLVAPGDEVIYSLAYENAGEKPATNVKLTMPVPDEVRFVENSARSEGASVAFSADNAKSYAPRGALTVSVNGETRAALSEDITHVQWRFPNGIPANSSGTVSYRAILN